ncbi:MAG: BON domain-containing protein [Parvibaculaceae bacterium]|nr:BON domain-containing protein [Parvibaculaceae bacterium]
MVNNALTSGMGAQGKHMQGTRRDSQISRRLAAPLLFGALLALPACTLQGTLIGAGATAGIAVVQERGTDEAFDDLTIQLRLNSIFLEEDSGLFASISTHVVEGRVLLLGVVATPEDRIRAAKLAWQTEGVVEVINEINVESETSLSQASKDLYITTSLRARLLGDGEVSAVNYKVETVRGTIYLLGISQNKNELVRVISHARDISGVRNIVTHVKDKSDQSR